MRALRNLAIFLVVVLAAGIALDFGVRIFLQNQVESEIEGADDRVDVGNVEAHIGSFPFLLRLGAKGEVTDLSLRLEDLVTPGVTFAVLQVNVKGLTFDRTVLFSAQVQVQHLDRATIKAEITADAVSDAVGVPVTFHPGQATVLVAGQERTATVAVANGDVTLAAEGIGVLTVTLSDSDYFPCAAGVQVKEGKVVLRCTTDQLPAPLRPYLGGAAT